MPPDVRTGADGGVEGESPKAGGWVDGRPNPEYGATTDEDAEEEGAL